MPKLQRKKGAKKGGYFITIPGELVERAGWKENETLYWVYMDQKNLKLEKG